jgi:hypothetical protein
MSAIASLFGIRDMDDEPRYIGFRIVVDLNEARRYSSNGGQITALVVAYDTYEDDVPTVNLWESDIPGARTGDNLSDIFKGAITVLAQENCRLAEGVWSRTGDNTYAAEIEVAA